MYSQHLQRWKLKGSRKEQRPKTKALASLAFSGLERRQINGRLTHTCSLCSTCADSVLLWAVMEIYGLEAVEQVDVRGGTGGGVFL